jgi:hypothetical protein
MPMHLFGKKQFNLADHLYLLTPAGILPDSDLYQSKIKFMGIKTYFIVRHCPSDGFLQMQKIQTSWYIS